MTTQWPGIAVETTKTNEVALIALFLVQLIQIERQPNARDVIVNINRINAKEMVYIHRILPIAQIG